MQDAAGCSVFELVALVKQRVETASNVQCSSLEKDYSAGTSLVPRHSVIGEMSDCRAPGSDALQLGTRLCSWVRVPEHLGTRLCSWVRVPEHLGTMLCSWVCVPEHLGTRLCSSVRVPEHLGAMLCSWVRVPEHSGCYQNRLLHATH